MGLAGIPSVSGEQVKQEAVRVVRLSTGKTINTKHMICPKQLQRGMVWKAKKKKKTSWQESNSQSCSLIWNAWLILGIYIFNNIVSACVHYGPYHGFGRLHTGSLPRHTSGISACHLTLCHSATKDRNRIYGSIQICFLYASSQKMLSQPQLKFLHMESTAPQDCPGLS